MTYGIWDATPLKRSCMSHMNTIVCELLSFPSLLIMLSAFCCLPPQPYGQVHNFIPRASFRPV